MEVTSKERNTRLNALITIGIFSTLFLSSYIFFKTPFEGYVSYIVIVVLLPFFLIRFPLPKGMLALLLFLLIFGLASVYVGDNTYPLFFKIFLNVTVSGLFYYYVFHAYNFNIEKIFNFYMKGAFIVAMIGLFQVFSYQIGFKPGYDFTWILNKWGVAEGGILNIRLNSIFSEPSYFSAAIGPAFFVSAYNIIRKKNMFLSKWQSLVIIVSYFLTFSSLAYLGVFLTLIIFLINFGLVRYVIIFLPLIIGSYLYLYTNVPEFRARIDGLDLLYSGEATSAFEVHGSSFVQFNNYHIATENLKRNPLFGTGLGSHEVAYEKYSLTKAFGGIYDFNKSDANSMALRLMSETGLFGLLFMALFVFKFLSRKNNDNSNEVYWLISGAALVIILLQLFRQGNYTYNGFFFYMWLYYFTFIKNKELNSEVNTSDKMVESNSSVAVE